MTLLSATFGVVMASSAKSVVLIIPSVIFEEVMELSAISLVPICFILFY